MMVVEVPPETMLVAVIVRVVPSGRVTVAVTALAVLGPALVITTVAVITEPGVALAGAVIAIARSATGFSGVAAVAVLLAGLLSGVVLATWPVKVWVVTLPAGTV